MFSLCDKFNRRLHDRTWPFRLGGGSNFGEKSAISNFNFSAILENVLNAYACLMKLSADDIDFQKECLELADEIFVYSLSV